MTFRRALLASTALSVTKTLFGFAGPAQDYRNGKFHGLPFWMIRTGWQVRDGR